MMRITDRIIKSLFVFLSTFSMFSISAGVTWGTVTTISSSNENGSSPSIAVDSSGNAIIVWVENGVILTKQGTNTGTWGDAERISGAGASLPYVLIDGSDNAIAVWLEGGYVKSKVKLVNQSWSSETTLSSSGASEPRVALDPAGNTIASWISGGVLYAVTGTLSGGWGTSEAISTSGASNSQVAIDSQGNAVAIWVQDLSSVPSIYSSYLLAGDRWSSPATISTLGTYCANPSLTMNSLADEKAVAIWYTYETNSWGYTNIMVQAASQLSDNSWSSPTTISWYTGLSISYPFASKVIIDRDGNVLAGWINSTNGSLFSFELSVKNANEDWSPIGMVGAPNPACYGFDIAAKGPNDYVAVWMSTTGITTELGVQAAISGPYMWGRMLWNDNVALSGSGSCGYPTVSLNYLDNTLYLGSCWLQYDGVNTTVQAILGEMSQPLPPTNLLVTQEDANYGLVSQTCNMLSWDASVTPNVGAYKIYRDGVYLETILANQITWDDDNQTSGASTNYQVQSIDTNQMVSELSTASTP